MANPQESDPIGSLLWDIFQLFTYNKAERLLSRTLAGGLRGFSDRPWMELVRGGSAGLERGLTEQWLAQRLRPYGIRPRSVRVGEERGKGYWEEDFTDAFRRYIPRSEVEALREEVRESGAGERAEGGEVLCVKRET